MRSALILSLLILFYSCAKTPAEEVDAAIDQALTYLSDDKCTSAIDLLEGVGRDLDNPIYLEVLGSAYACRAGYNEIVFLSSEISKIDSSAANLMKSLTTLILSNEKAADSVKYLDLQEGIDVLLYVDSSQPSQVAREAKYGPRKAGDMGVQALLMALTQIGKFIDFYGNVNALGAKGAGLPSVDEQGAIASNCFLEYTEARSLVFLGAGGGGVCNDMATDNGHPDLSFAAPDLATTKKRMCQGLMLVTNIIDILGNITLPASSSYGNLSSVATTVAALKTSITTADPALTTLVDTTSQADCETLIADASEFDNLQFIYALLFEAGLP